MQIYVWLLGNLCETDIHPHKRFFTHVVRTTGLQQQSVKFLPEKVSLLVGDAEIEFLLYK